MITAEVKNVYQDVIRGSIIVETEYKNGDDVIQIGNTRYTEETGDEQAIIDKIKEDIKIHCDNLVKRIPANETYIREQTLARQKELTQPLITKLLVSAVGLKDSAEEVSVTYKDKVITVDVDSNNSVSDVA